MSMSLLDAYIPTPDVRERHTIVVRAPAATVWATAEAFDFQSVGMIRGIVRMRELLLGTTRVARRPQPFLLEALGMGWGELERSPGRHFVAGAHCQPWLGNVKFIPIPAAEFAGFSAPNRVKIAWTLEVEALGASRSRVITETRAVATDAEAKVRFRQYWRWARFGIVTIRWFMLPAIKRRAERDWHIQRQAT